MQARQKYFTPLGFFSKAADNYAQNHQTADGQIAATLELLILTGFAPAPNQQQPSPRGSGKQPMVF
jgi:hypothetical protein